MYGCWRTASSYCDSYTFFTAYPRTRQLSEIFPQPTRRCDVRIQSSNPDFFARFFISAPFPPVSLTTLSTSLSPSHDPLLSPHPRARSQSRTPHPSPISRQRLQLIVRIHFSISLRRSTVSRVHVLLPSALCETMVFIGSDVFRGECYGGGLAAEHGWKW